MTRRVDARRLREHVRALFARAGADGAVSDAVAAALVEGDLLGYHTHGVGLSRGYLADLRAGKASGAASRLPRIPPSPATSATDCGYVLGAYAVDRALAATTARAAEFGVGAVALSRAHHIGCLAGYLSRRTDDDVITVLMSSNPARASVAPHGGISPVLSPNPVALRIPTADVPVIVDISTSSVPNGAVTAAYANGTQLEHPVLTDHEGNPSDAPADLFGPPPGSIQPLGGREFGHKGFGLGLMVEALTSGLAGFGRRDGPDGLGASVFVMALAARGFAGGEALRAETSHLARLCRRSRPLDPERPVRLPGSAALARKAEYQAAGIPLPADALASLTAASAEQGIQLDLDYLSCR